MDLVAGEPPLEAKKGPLWAPWRLEYVEGPPPGGCIFCDKPSLGADRAALIVARWETCYAILNRFPYNNGHLMLAPFRHEAELSGLEPKERYELADKVALAGEALKRAFAPDGLNVGLNLGAAAGAGVAGHLHWHIVPRWHGDTNFMPVLADTKVIPQALEKTWEILETVFEDLG
jgi:ATP adenylyltransferase